MSINIPYKKVGEVLGSRLVSTYKHLGENLGKKTNVFGLERLEMIPQKDPVIFVGNYVGPERYFGKSSAPFQFGSGFLPSPSSLLNIFSEVREKNIVPVIATGMEIVDRNGELIPMSADLLEAKREFILGAGMIPVNKLDGVGSTIENRHLFRAFEQTIPTNDVLMFAEGAWRNQGTLFSEYNFHPHAGPAILAVKYGVTIVPFYHDCPESWFDKDTISILNIGNPILPSSNSSRKEQVEIVVNQIRSSVVSLQRELMDI